MKQSTYIRKSVRYQEYIVWALIWAVISDVFRLMGVFEMATTITAFLAVGCVIVMIIEGIGIPLYYYIEIKK